ncbi:MAG: hypothetical protein IT305_28230 [Chloroflexi bacterium]|nr:hypothetical protein [Chloroflexota bacterium]
MEHLGSLFGSLSLGRRRGGRLTPPKAEREIVDAVCQPDVEPGLSAYVPSSLIPTDERVRAMIVGGAPAWSRRLKQIHDLTVAATAQLEQEWRALARRHQRHPDRFAQEWRRRADSVDFARINDLIDRHNRHFPTEANLPMDIRTRDYVGWNGGDYRRQHLTPAWVLDLFPPDLGQALAEAGAEAGMESQGATAR